MCGINGLINFSNAQEAIVKMNASIKHRGPDADGFFQHENTTLGHVRLSIIDLSQHANQPMISQNEDFIIVYNGEVYNSDQIKEKYQLNCSTTSDTEVILEGFAKIGANIVKELNGMFALAILNKVTGELFIARDRVGIKPLYVFQKGSQLAFSSELKGLYSVPEVKGELTINKEAVAGFFNLGYIPQPLTIFNEIEKFPAGHFAFVKEGRLTKEQYWSTYDNIQLQTKNDFGEAKSELHDLLTDSVKLRLKSDVPFGTLLSGGIDSSLVTAIAQANSDSTINTFSIGFKEKSHNEAVFAKQVADVIKTNHHEFTVTQKEALDLVPEIISSYDEPYGDSSSIPTMLVSKLARQHVKVTLSGDGGDELFHGYGFYNWASRLNKPMVKALKAPIGAALKLGNNRMKRASNMFKYKKGEFKSHLFSQEQYYFSSFELDELLNPDFANIPSFLNQTPTLNRKLSPAEEQSLFDINYYLKDELLVKVDIASMKFSLEDRVPILDHRIVEFALNLNEKFKIKDGVQKHILKEILYDYVPKEIFDRPKQGFSIPLGSWLKSELSGLIDTYITEENFKEIGFLNFPFAQKIVARYRAGEDFLYTRVWSLIVFISWYKQFMK